MIIQDTGNTEKVVQKLTIDQSAENKCVWSAQAQTAHLLHISTPKTRRPSQKRG